MPTGCAYDYISSSVGWGIRYNVYEGVSCQDDENCVCDGTEEPFETVISGTCEFPIATYEACDEAATALGFAIYPLRNTEYPPGCTRKWNDASVDHVMYWNYAYNSSVVAGGSYWSYCARTVQTPSPTSWHVSPGAKIIVASGLCRVREALRLGEWCSTCGARALHQVAIG